MLDVRRLKVLKEVAAKGSFSAAAESLAYTQSAVSQQIAALEREAGLQLVERNARGVNLTEAGRVLVEHADVILRKLADAEAELEAMAGLRGGRLRLVAFPSAGASIMPEAVARFRGLHPAVLAQGGLRSALAMLARRSPVPVELDVRVSHRLPEQVEVSAYYIVAEALTNAVKHAHASAVAVAVHVDDTSVSITVRDDGRGGASVVPGGGLAGLADRVAALGGTFALTDGRTGAGTTAVVSLPTGFGLAS